MQLQLLRLLGLLPALLGSGALQIGLTDAGRIGKSGPCARNDGTVAARSCNLETPAFNGETDWPR
jgi:hypothetical protein